MEKSFDDQELATAPPEERNWKGIGLALLVILIICSLVVTAVVLLSPEPENFSNKARVRLQEVLSGQYKYRRSNVTWETDHEFLYRDMHGALIRFNARKNTSISVVSNSTFRQYKVEEYSMSKNRKYLLFAVDKTKIHKHTSKARYIIFDTKTQNAEYLHPRGREKVKLQYAKWGTQGSEIVFVYHNNIYYAPDARKAMNRQEIQITYNGEVGVYFNGIPDWLYEEEIFKSDNVIWWSPSGKYLSYLSINDTRVQSLVYPVYGPFSDSSNLYPQLEALRYPKPDTNNPVPTLWTINLKNIRKPPIKIRPPREFHRIDHYIISVSWIDNERLSVTWLNRKQNRSLIQECTANSNQECNTIANIRAPGSPDGKAWIEMFEAPVRHANEKIYLKLPLTNTRTGYYQHIAKITLRNERTQFLTRGEYEVTKILSFDSKTATLFYMATRSGKAGERNLYSVKDALETTYHQPKCLTCHLVPECLFNDVQMSPKSKYFILECLGPRVPFVALFHVENNSMIRMLDENSEVQAIVAYRALPQNRTFIIPLTSEFKAEVRLYLPPGFRESSPKKYPMVVQAFGGPGTQMVNDKFQIGWSTYLTSQRKFIYAYIDVRGSGYRGDKLVQEIYGQLGQIDAEDQLIVINHLAHNLHYVDEAHIAMWGKGYGGYIVTRALSNKLGSVLRCGIAVAPITSWIYYNSMFSERYMQTYQDNRNGYKNSDAMLKAANFKGRKFLLIHGSADDQVHFQQSMMLAMALNSNGVMYRSQFYPDEDHELSGVQEHLHRTMEGFLDDCFEQTYVFYS